jgi:hypothetical protein
VIIVPLNGNAWSGPATIRRSGAPTIGSPTGSTIRPRIGHKVAGLIGSNFSSSTAASAGRADNQNAVAGMLLVPFSQDRDLQVHVQDAILQLEERLGRLERPARVNEVGSEPGRRSVDWNDWPGLMRSERNPDGGSPGCLSGEKMIWATKFRIGLPLLASTARPSITPAGVISTTTSPSPSSSSERS